MNVTITNQSSQFDNNSFNWWWSFIRTDILLLLGIVALFGSLLIIVVILKYPSMRKKEDSIHMIGFLAVADGITGLGTAVIAINWLRIQLLEIKTYTRGECIAVFTVNVCGIFSSQLMIAWIGLDRLMAIKNPMTYIATDHFRFAYRSFLGTLLWSVVSAVAMFHGDLNHQPLECSIAGTVSKQYTIYFAAFSGTVPITIIVLYAAILIGLRKKTSGLISGQSALAAQLLRQARVTRTVSLILGLYIVLWVTPTYLFVLSSILGASDHFLTFIGPFVALGAAASSASNILIYSYKMPTFRLYLKKFFRGENDNGIIPASSIYQASNLPVNPRRIINRIKQPTVQNFEQVAD